MQQRKRVVYARRQSWEMRHWTFCLGLTCYLDAAEQVVLCLFQRGQDSFLKSQLQQQLQAKLDDENLFQGPDLLGFVRKLSFCQARLRIWQIEDTRSKRL